MLMSRDCSGGAALPGRQGNRDMAENGRNALPGSFIAQTPRDGETGQPKVKWRSV